MIKTFWFIFGLFIISNIALSQGIGNGCPDQLSQQFTTNDIGLVGVDQWQAFTNGVAGKLTRVDVFTNGCGAYTYTLNIYNGTGTTGGLLYSGVYTNSGICNAAMTSTIPVASAPNVTNGGTYTFRILSSASAYLIGNWSNSYAGGYYYSDAYGTQATWDLNFRIYTQLNTYPVASITAATNLSLCPSNSVVLNANAGTFSYQWYNSAGVISAASAQSYTAISGGPYAAVITNTNTNCFSTSNTLTILTNTVPNTYNSFTICNGSSIILTSIQSGTSNWSTSATTPTISVSPNVLTQYFVQATAPNGCVTETITDIYVNASPTLNVNANTATVNLGSISTINSNFATVYFPFSDPLPANARIFAFEFDYDGIDQGWGGTGCNLNTSVSNDGAGSATLSHTLTHYNYLVPTSAPNYSYGATNNVGISFCGWGGWQGFANNAKLIIHYDLTFLQGCAGTTRTLTAQGANAYTWTPSITNGIGFTPTATAVYSVTGAMSSGCSATRVLTVQVNPIPSLSVSGGNTVCAGGVINNSILGADTYSWSTGGTLSAYPFTPNPNINYTIVGTYSNTGCSNQIVMSLSAIPLPTISVPNYTLCAGKSITFTPTGAASYIYSSGTSIVSPSTNTFYTISGTSSLGCNASVAAISNVTVYALPPVSISNGSMCIGSNYTMSPNGALSYSYSSGTAVVSPPSTTSYTVTGINVNTCTNIAVATISVYARPSVSVSSGSICLGQNFTLSPGGATTYNFLNGGPVVSPALTSTYAVSGTNSLGCTSTLNAIATVTVHNKPIVSVNSGSICSGLVFTMQPSGASSYFYSSVSNTVNPIITTSYSVTGTSSVGCLSSNTAVSTVTVETTPSITVSNGTICTGDTFTINPQGANSYSIQGNATLVNPTVTSSYQVIGLSPNLCPSAPVTMTVLVNLLPTIVASITPSVICIGASVIPLATGAANYSWTSGLVNNTSANPTVSKTYTITGKDSNGCVNTAITAVTVNPLPILNVSSTNNQSCEAETVTLTVNGANTYTWLPLALGNNVVISPTSSVVYTVTGKDFNNCVSTSIFTQSVVICAGSFTAYSSQQDVECENKDNGIISVFAGSNYSQQHLAYFWTPSTLCPNNDCAVVDNLAAGIYKVKVLLTYTLNNLFVKKDSIMLGPVSIEDENGPCNITVFRGISANIDGKNDRLYIENIEEYPKNNITIFNRWGLKVAEIQGYDNRDRIWPDAAAFEKLQSSTYFYIIDLGDGTKVTKGWIELIKN